MFASLAHLPTELYSAILNNVPEENLQKTVLSLTRVIPFSPIPLDYLFRCIRITHGDQAILLQKRLRTDRDAANWIQLFSVETWDVDADVAINIVRILPKLSSLSICIGPSNFAPEHLEEMFAKSMPNLRYLALRFRPYVQRATYYQFLKGSYFDSTLIAISRWPPETILPTLSIVQDPLDIGTAQKQAFAQPLVFFRLDPLTTLVRSSPLHKLTSFRLRVPSRQIARFIYSHPDSIHSLQYLDISTCNVLDSEVDALLVRFRKLEHLILDGCAVISRELREGEWNALGKRCALVGVRRAKEREKKLKAWLEVNFVLASHLQAVQVVDPAPEPTHIRRGRRGRRGLSTAPLSLRASPPRADPSVEVTPTLRANVPKIRILPSMPTLVTLATTIPTTISQDLHSTIRADFERGWAEGLAQLSAIRARLKQSWRNDVRVVRYSDIRDTELVGEEGLEGLVDIRGEDAFDVPVVGDGIRATPVLCLAGPGRAEEHLEGCGHSIGWDIWKDEL